MLYERSPLGQTPVRTKKHANHGSVQFVRLGGLVAAFNHALFAMWSRREPPSSCLLSA